MSVHVAHGGGTQWEVTEHQQRHDQPAFAVTHDFTDIDDQTCPEVQVCQLPQGVISVVSAVSDRFPKHHSFSDTAPHGIQVFYDCIAMSSRETAYRVHIGNSPMLTQW